MDRAIALTLFLGGLIAAGLYAYAGFFLDDQRPIGFAIACLVAVIGWRELGHEG